MDALTQKNLPRLGLGRESLREDDDIADRAVVVAAFETDATERRVPRRDPDTESELVALLLPGFGQLAEPLAHHACHTDRLQLVALDRERIVEPHHHSVAREVLEGAVVRDDELAHRPLVLAKQTEDLLGFRRLGEGGEPAKVQEDDRDLPPMSIEHLRALLARDQRCDLRREEARKFPALPFDGLEELDVRDGDRGLVSEGADERDFLLAEGGDRGPCERDDPQHTIVADERNRE